MRWGCRKACTFLIYLVLLPAPAFAEWQIRPFFGFTFAGSTTYFFVEDGVDDWNPTWGVAGGFLGEVFGLEAELALAPGFFESFASAVPGGPPEQLLAEGSLATLMGHVVVALPRRLAQYSLRPYFSGGAGIMWVRIDAPFASLVEVADTLPAMSLGGGATGFLTERVGLSWDLRRFQSLSGLDGSRGVSLGPEELSYWRATMALAIRY
jgi:hypothetical protein